MNHLNCWQQIKLSSLIASDLHSEL